MSGTADLVLHSGRVFTGSGLHPSATAVAVSDGRVAAVGTDAEVRDRVGPGTRTVDLAGRLVLPGFTDAHVHPVMGGLERLGCDLSEVHGAGAALDRVAAYAAAHPGEWISAGAGRWRTSPAAPRAGRTSTGSSRTAPSSC